MDEAARLAALAKAAHHLQAAKMFQLASYVFLVYDHIITFAEEVERIWTKRWSIATLLFALNRYVTPLQFLIIIVAFHSPEWTKNIPACDRFVRFEGGVTLALVAICEIIMMMRVYALWGRDNRILGLMVFAWAAQVAGGAIAISASERTILPPGFVGCILTARNNLLLPIWVMPLITDTIIFILTLWRSRQYMIYQASMPMLRLLVRDGAQYFFCIFAANLLNSIFFLAATQDLKPIGASFSQMITSVMISRLVLNLRNLRDCGITDDDSTGLPSTGGPVVLTLPTDRRDTYSYPMSAMDVLSRQTGSLHSCGMPEMSVHSTGAGITWQDAIDDVKIDAKYY